ncbi:MAG TPA: hypothetical protein VFK33_05195 [Bacillales bacterium]|nr:hypothetical protein [Bacillales bacterium]
MKVKEPPAFNQGSSITPRGYVDRDFTWINSHVLTVSRARERDWTNDQDKWPNPYLVRVDVQAGTQEKLTRPPEGKGDFYPTYLASIHKLSWVRSNGKKADVFIGTIDGSKSSLWIHDIDDAGNYYGRWFWDSDLDWYEG